MKNLLYIFLATSLLAGCKKEMKTQLSYLLILFSVASYSQKSNSLGIEAGLHSINNRNYGSNDPERFFPITDNSLYLAIPFEHHWTKKNSLILSLYCLLIKTCFG